MAWLVTWEGTTPEDFPRGRKVVAVLHHAVAPANVKRVIEALYLALATSEEDIVNFGRTSKQNPYPARKSTIDGVGIVDDLRCGHNPHLWARKVRQVRWDAQTDCAAWTELDLPSPGELLEE